MKTFSSIVIVLWIVAMYFLFSSVIVKAELTPNLLTNDFTDGSWSGTNLTSRHGNNTIAGIHGKYVESTISLIDDAELHQVEFNNGFTSTQQAEIWFWNSNSQSVLMKQTIVADSGAVVTQTKEISGSCEQYNGCSYNSSGNNTIIINQNTESDYDITSRFSFSVPGNQSGHTGADLKNPSLIISYEQPDFYNLDTWEIIELQWEDDVFEEFYFEEFEEQDFLFTSPPTMNFELQEDYIIEYEDYIIEYEDFETEFEMESEYEMQPQYEMLSDEIDTFFSEEELNYTENEYFETDEFYEEEYEEESFDEEEEYEEEIPNSDSELSDNDDKEPEREMKLTEDDEIEKPIESKKEEIKEDAVEVIETVVEKKVNIKKIKVSKFDFMKFEAELKISTMVSDKTDEFFTPTIFYPKQTLYELQPAIFDNREIYKDIAFIADDPLVVFETKLRNNRNIQNQQRAELEQMTWKN